MTGYVGRLAPSPTGLLHAGHAQTFGAAARRARDAGGLLLLRVDDLDRDRCRAEYAEAMLEDLAWLRLGCGAPAVWQSERIGLYHAALKQLLAAGMAYACGCSRRELQQAVGAPHDEDDEPVYGGRCRPRRGSPQRFVEGVSYRFRVHDGEPVEFVDGNLGPQRFIAGCDASCADFGDFVLWRRDGLPSYQLATVVDDAAMGVTEVVRGRDLLRSTARQMLVARALGVEGPAWFHTELVRDAQGVRLAKRHDALSVRTLREQGWSAAEVLAGERA